MRNNVYSIEQKWGSQFFAGQMFPLPLTSWKPSHLSRLGIGGATSRKRRLPLTQTAHYLLEGPELNGSMGTVSSLSTISLFRVDSMSYCSFVSRHLADSLVHDRYFRVFDKFHWLDMWEAKLKKKKKAILPWLWKCLSNHPGVIFSLAVQSEMHSAAWRRQGHDAGAKRRCDAFPVSRGHKGEKKKHRIYSITNFWLMVSVQGVLRGCLRCTPLSYLTFSVCL